MKALFYLLLYSIKLKPIDFTDSVHRQISPKYIEMRKKTRAAFLRMEEQCKVVSDAMKHLSFTFTKATKSVRMVQDGFLPFYKQYIEGLRKEYNRYYETLNSPLWR